MSNEKREIVLGKYRFLRFARRLTVTSVGKKDEEELKTMATLYQEHYKNSRRGGVLYSGKWQWCLNSEECRKAVYAPVFELKKTQGRIFCSHYCANKVRGAKGRKQVVPQRESAVEKKKRPETMQKEEITVVIKGYVFTIKDRRIVAEFRGNHDEEELKTIARLYAQYRTDKYAAGRRLAGEWRWCKNPDCNNAFYARRYIMEEGQAMFCSHSCTKNAPRIQKDQQVSRPIDKSERKEIPAVAQSPTPIIVQSPAPVAVQSSAPVAEIIGHHFECSNCGAILDKIRNCPGRCPTCGEIAVFISAE